MEITKIVITGGPCAGKTTAMSWIQHHFTRMGYTVLFIPETATELITGGVAPWTCGTNLDYQKCQVRLQLVKEELFEQAARTMNAEKVLIICDRGFMDNKAYMNDEEFAAAVASVNGNVVALRDSYDAVFHLVTAAKGAQEFYTTDNNAARYESVEEACAMDDKLIAAWTGHPHLRVIDNSTSFDEKLKKLMNEIISFLGIENPIETEKKFLIAYPDLDWLANNPYCHKIDIIQTFLTAPAGEERKVRQRGEDGHYMCYVTTKIPMDETGLKRIETEHRISENEYSRLLGTADPDKAPLHKTRYCLTYEHQYFEVDVYPFWKDRAILEIELSQDDQQIIFPPQLHVYREITGEKEYKSTALAEMVMRKQKANAGTEQ